MLRKTLNISSNIRKCTFCMNYISQKSKNYEKLNRTTNFSHNNQNFIINRHIAIGKISLAKQHIPMIIIDDDLGPLPLVGRHKEIFLISTIHHRLGFTPEDAKRILRKYAGIRYHTSVSITKVLNLLAESNVRNEVIVDNLWVLAPEYEFTKIKLDIIKEIVPANGDINDFIPLMKTTVARLNLIKEAAKKDSNNIPGGHRLYFISDKLNIKPDIIARSLSKNLSIFRMKFEYLKEILQLLLDYNIQPKDIIKYWQPFRYSPIEIKKRLKIIKLSNHPNPKPWLTITHWKFFDRALVRSRMEAKILGGKSVIEFLANRLNFDIAFTANMLTKFPIPYVPRASTIVKVLDLLLNEAGYTSFDIAQCPRILFHSVDTTRTRLNELKELGYKPMSLVTVCRSETEYRKTIERFRENMNKCTISNKMKQIKCKQ